jgi:hypothetical protein
MPFVEYSSSSQESQRAQEAVLRSHEFGVSMMERATRNRAMMQDIEQRKVRFVNEQIMDDQQIQLNRQKLAEMEADQVVNAAKRRTAVAEQDARAKGTVINEQLLENASTQLPYYLALMQKTEDPYEVDQIAGEFMDKYGRLAENPLFADRFAPIGNEVTALFKSRKGAFMGRVNSAVEKLGQRLDTSDPKTIAKSIAEVRNDPAFRFARINADFRKAFDVAQSKAAEYAFKEQEAQAKKAADIEVNRAKAEDDIKVNAAKSKTDRKEAPQYLVEKAMKIDQSSKDLVELESMVNDEVTGPFVGFFRKLNPYDTTAQAFEAKLRATVPNLARGIFGEVGVLTDADVKNYMATLPSLKSPQARTKKLLEMLRGTLETQRTNVSSIVKGQGYKTEGLPGLEPSKEQVARKTPVTDGADLAKRIEDERKRRKATGLR